MYYFAYGNNLDPENLERLKVDYSVVCPGKVKNFRLVFYKPAVDGSGMADMQAHKGSFVEGVVYDVPEASLANLDVYEGVDKGHYRREMVTVQTRRGELECVAYRAAKFRTGLKPTHDYLAMMVKGAEQHRLSQDYVTFLKSHNSV